MARLVPVIATAVVLACTPDRTPSPAATGRGAAPTETPVVAPAPTTPAASEEPVTEPERPALDIEYVPTPENVVAVMLETAEVGPNDYMIDLGCGDGRLLVEAAKRFGTRGFGVDLDPDRIAEARANIEQAGVGHLVKVEQRNIFSVDLSPATVVTLYLLPELNVRLIPQLQQLRPGARIVSHDFDMQGVDYEDVKTVISKHHRPPPEFREHYVYRWTAPLQVTVDPEQAAER